MDWYAPDALAKTEAYDLTAERRRRIALRVLVGSDQKWTVDRLAGEVAARERGGSETVDEETRARIRLALVHQDLPKLDGESVVELDYDERTVAPGEHIDDLVPLL